MKRGWACTLDLQKSEKEQTDKSYMIHEGLKRKACLTTKFPFYTFQIFYQSFYHEQVLRFKIKMFWKCF